MDIRDFRMGAMPARSKARTKVPEEASYHTHGGEIPFALRSAVTPLAISGETADRASEQIAERIGATIKEARTARGWTVRELADRSGVSKALISALEQRRGNPAVNTLWRLSAALSLHLSDLVERPATEVEIVRRDERRFRETRDRSMTRRILFVSEERRRIELFETQLAAGARSVWASHPTAPPFEYVIVLEGRLIAGPLGKEVELEVGDAMAYNANTTHIFAAPYGKVRYLLVLAH
jgi:transcriptional regulator with XRE-family HTH domain